LINFIQYVAKTFSPDFETAAEDKAKFSRQAYLNAKCMENTY
jgi:hypothetical protein